MKTRVTLTLDSDLLREVKSVAAGKRISVSELLVRKFREIVPQRRSYEAARRRALARLKKGYDLRFEPCIARRFA